MIGHLSYGADLGEVSASEDFMDVILGDYARNSLVANDVGTLTITTTRWEDCVGSGNNYEPIRYFNCKRCGAVGQHGVCEYCGSAEE